MIKPTEREVKAAEEIRKYVFDSLTKKFIHTKSEWDEVVPQIIADSRPEPSQDDEALAREIVKKVLDDYWGGKEFVLDKKVKEILPFLARRSVTVDVEKCAEEIRNHVNTHPSHMTSKEWVITPFVEQDFIDIITHHLHNAPEPTKSQEEWAREMSTKIVNKFIGMGVLSDVIEKRKEIEDILLSSLPAPTQIPIVSVGEMKKGVFFIPSPAPTEAPELPEDVEELIKELISGLKNYATVQEDLFGQAATALSALATENAALKKRVEELEDG